MGLIHNTRLGLDSCFIITVIQSTEEVRLRQLEGVRALRESRVLTQQELAEQAGVSLFTIQRIERGEGNVRPSTARAVAEALGVEVEAILPKASASPSPQLSFNNHLERERRAEVLGALRTYIIGRGNAHDAEVRDENSLVFRNAATATLWAAMVREEAKMWCDWIIEQTPALLPPSEGLGDPQWWRNATLFVGPVLMFNTVAKRAEQRIAAMSDQPDELTQKRLEKARRAAEESAQRLEELRKASNA
jgi:transcriptional regulator with XRE-family HTH domain